MVALDALPLVVRRHLSLLQVVGTVTMAAEPDAPYGAPYADFRDSLRRWL